MFGLGYGFTAKFESPIPFEVGSGGSEIVYSSLKPASHSDSARTAKAFPNHPVSQAFNAKQASKIFIKTKIFLD